MLALCLALTLALFWTLVGKAVLLVCRAGEGVLRAWLLAPAVGLAVTVLALMVGNQAGFPIGRMAFPLAAVLAVLAAAVLAACRPALPRALIPFVGAAAFFVLWAGWPMLHFGYHWTGYVNDDYLNYCLAADRFRDFGFYRAPTLPELTGRDYGQFYWFMHVLELMRFGSEHVIAWVAALVGLRTVFVFAPVILAMGVTQLGAAAALVLHRGRWRRAAQCTVWLLAASPLFVFGAIYQLIAQVGGLGLLLAFLSLMTRRLTTRRRWRLFGQSVPAALTMSALAVFYPEVSPFAWLALFVFLAAEAFRLRRIPGARIVQLEYILILFAVLLRHNLISYFYTLARQFVSGAAHQDLSMSLFPFFLLPCGLASLFGFQTMTGLPPEPLGSILIVVGALLLLCALATGVRLLRRQEPLAALLLVELAMAAMLFRAGSDFGLYKIAMYLQPALGGALAWAVFRRRGAWTRLLAAAYLLAVLPTGLAYVRGSIRPPGVVINEMLGASDRVAHMPALPAPNGVWGAGFDNLGAAKFAANRYRGTEIRLLDKDYFHATFTIEADYPLMQFYPHRELYAAGHALWEATKQEVYREEVLFGANFSHVQLPSAAGFLIVPQGTGFFNKLPAVPHNPDILLDQVTAEHTRNLALLVNSSRGNLYYLADRRRIGLGQREYDSYDPAGGIYAMGPFLLIRVERPSDVFYLRLAATKSLKGHGNTRWSGGSQVLGMNAAALPLVGDGAANVFAGPVRPVWKDGAAYIGVDFREIPTQFPSPRTGLNRLYNAKIPLDYRRTVAFGRDLSVLTAQEMQALQGPRRISSFPRDLLTNPGLRFSGIYEDGWVSEAAYAVLAPAAPGECLRLRGYVPRLPGRTEPTRLVLTVGGRPLPPLTLSPGNFDWLLPVSFDAEGCRLEIACSNPAVLPGADGRPVSVKLLGMELVNAPAAFDFSTAGGGAPLGTGVDADGWAAEHVRLTLPAPLTSARVELVVEYPDWGTGPKESRVRVSVDGAPPEERPLLPGRTTWSLPVKPGAARHTLALSAPAALRLPAPDGRQRSLRLISATFRP